jgi:selenide,water dikinase
VLGAVHSQPDDRVIVGHYGADDAAVVRLDDGKLLVQTVDFFTPIVDDPYQFGQIAAANSLSDIYAMGGRPLFALNIVAFPIKTLPRSLLSTILQGGADKAQEAGISIVGGHSIDDPEPKYGLVVTGEVDGASLVTNASAKPGDVLVLTKPLGTGILATAIKKGLAPEENVKTAVESMALLNKVAAEVMLDVGVHAATDVTGFGLLGHLLELCQASQVTARIDFSTLSFLPGVVALAEQGIIPGGTKRNLKHVDCVTSFDPKLGNVQRALAADPQTSGGLLLALPPEKAPVFLQKYNPQAPFPAVVIGEVVPRQEKQLHLLTSL